MRDATISTSRTRATPDHLIDYRPLPEAWGDRAALQSVRASRTRAAMRGEDPSTLQLSATAAGASSEAAHTEPSHPATVRPDRTPLLSSLRRASGIRRRVRHQDRPLMTV